MFLHKNKILLIVFCSAAAICFSACGDYFFPEFKVEDSYLIDGKAVAFFSAQIAPESAMKNFLLVQDESQMEGEFFFDGRKMTFCPKQKTSPNHRYKILVYAGAMDINGNTLQKDYQKIIYTKSDLEAPKVLNVKAINGPEGETTALEITFSKGVNEESFSRNFSMEPKKDFFTIWSDDFCKARIEFREPLKERTLHSIKIQKDFIDRLNNKMENDFYWSWTNEENAKNPNCFIFAVPFGEDNSQEIFADFDNADFTKEIELFFDKKVLVDSVASSVFIEPELSFSIIPKLEENGEYCKSAKIKLNEKIKWNSQLRLTIRGQIKDKSGFCVPERNILMKNNCEKARPPKLEFAALTVCGKNHFASLQENYPVIEFPIEEYPSTECKEVPIYFVFSISQDSERMDETSAKEGINASAGIAGSLDLRKVESLSESEFCKRQDFFEDEKTKSKILQLKLSGKKLCAIRFAAYFKSAEIDRKPVSGLIELSASEKLCDNNKNFMEEKTQLTCNKI